MSKGRMNKNNKHNHGFENPKNYFENFEDRILEKLDEQRLPKNEGFIVPEDYFNTLDDKILEKITNTENTKVRPLFTRRFLLLTASVAACLALAFTFWPTKKITTLDAIEASEIASYIEEENLSIDSYDIAQILSEDEIEELSIVTEITNKQLQDYLLDSVDDNTLLIE